MLEYHELEQSIAFSRGGIYSIAQEIAQDVFGIPSISLEYSHYNIIDFDTIYSPTSTSRRLQPKDRGFQLPSSLIGHHLFLFYGFAWAIWAHTLDGMFSVDEISFLP